MRLSIVRSTSPSPGQVTRFPAEAAEAAEATWKSLYRVAAVAALAVVAVIPIQGVVYAINPPPTAVLDYFTLFERSPLRGLLALDLLLMVDYVLLVLVYLGLYAALRRVSPSLMAIGTTLALVAAAVYFSSSVAFEMLALSARYAEAATEAQRSTLLAAGEALLVTYTGSAYLVSYFLGAVAAILFSVVMFRSTVFGRWAAYAGLTMGVLSLVPSTAGTVGLIASFLSLLPTAVWLVLVGQRFLQLAHESSQAEVV
jgi:hypothetical protein